MSENTGEQATQKLANEEPSNDVSNAARLVDVAFAAGGLSDRYENSVERFRLPTIIWTAVLVMILNVCAFSILIFGSPDLVETGVGIALVTGPFVLSGTYIGLLLRGILSRPQASVHENAVLTEAIQNALDTATRN